MSGLEMKRKIWHFFVKCSLSTQLQNRSSRHGCDGCVMYRECKKHVQRVQKYCLAFSSNMQICDVLLDVGAEVSDLYVITSDFRIIWGFWSNEHGQHIPSTTKLSYTITLQSRTVFGCASVNTVRGQYPTNRARSLWEFGLRSIRCSANRARFGTTQSRSSPHKHRDSIGQLHEHGYLVGN